MQAVRKGVVLDLFDLLFGKLLHGRGAFRNTFTSFEPLETTFLNLERHFFESRAGLPLENIPEGAFRGHRSSNRDNRASSSLFARRNAAPMMHGAVTAADLDHCRGWLLESASHFSSCGALTIVLFAADARDLPMRSNPVR